MNGDDMSSTPCNEMGVSLAYVWAGDKEGRWMGENMSSSVGDDRAADARFGVIGDEGVGVEGGEAKVKEDGLGAW